LNDIINSFALGPEIPSMKPSIEQLEVWDKLYNWHPFTPMAEYLETKPIMITRASGFFLFDQFEKKYIDGFSSLWCNLHGHQVPELDAALSEQMGKVAHSTFLGLSNEPATLLSKKLIEIAPSGLTRVFYSDSGATAVEVALKMAFQFCHQTQPPLPNKKLFLSFGLAYHGDTMGSVSIGDLGQFHDMFKPLLFPTIKAPAPFCYRCPLKLQRDSCNMACALELEKLVEENADQLVAVIIEPLVQGAAGMVTAPAGFLKRVREVTKKNKVLLIADEVAVGFGRTGTLFACEQEEVVPDFLCLAKGITGGYLPLAATLTTELIFNAFLNQPGQPDKTFQHGHTFTANPLGAAVAIASLNLLTKENGTLEKVAAKGHRLQQHLDRLKQFSFVGDIRRVGLMIGIEIVQDKATRLPFHIKMKAAHRICLLAIEQGLMIRPLGDVVVVMPPLAIPEEMLDVIGEVLYNCFMEFSQQIASQEG